MADDLDVFAGEDVSNVEPLSPRTPPLSPSMAAIVATPQRSDTQSVRSISPVRAISAAPGLVPAQTVVRPTSPRALSHRRSIEAFKKSDSSTSIVSMASTVRAYTNYDVETARFGESATDDDIPDHLSDVMEDEHEGSDEEIHRPVARRLEGDGSMENVDIDPSKPAATSTDGARAEPEENDPDMVVLQEDSFGRIIEPTHVLYQSDRASIAPSQDLAFSGIYYPTPIPAKLKLPPLLSRRSRNSASFGGNTTPTLDVNLDVKRRRRSTVLSMNLQKPPQWGPSPLEAEVSYEAMDGHAVLPHDDSFDLDDQSMDSDVATMMSGDADELESDFEHEDRDADAVVAAKRQKRGTWASTAWEAFTGKTGRSKLRDDYEAGRDDDDNSLQDGLREDDAFAFSRYDPEKIRQHAEMFNSGGVYNSTVPRTGGQTSLIEEIEIRKAGRRMQNRYLAREINEHERSRSEEQARNSYIHPMDKPHRPTLLEMQHMAEADYNNRVSWHANANHKAYIKDTSPTPANETLAARRARLKARNQPAVTETLAERRARLRQQRETLKTVPATPPSEDAAPAGAQDVEEPDRSLENDEGRIDDNDAEQPIPGTPASFAGSFDYAKAIAQRSPQSLIMATPVVQ